MPRRDQRGPRRSASNSRRRTTRLAALARARLHAACMRPVRRTWNPRNLGWARCAVGRYVQHPTHPFYDGLRATLTTPELGVTISAPDVLDQCRNPRTSRRHRPGLAALAPRDRTAVGVARRRWSSGAPRRRLPAPIVQGSVPRRRPNACFPPTLGVWASLRRVKPVASPGQSIYAGFLVALAGAPCRFARLTRGSGPGPLTG